MSQHFGKILRFDASRGFGVIRSPDFTESSSTPQTHFPEGQYPAVGDEVVFDRSHRQVPPVAVNVKLSEPWPDYDRRALR
jgi:hypothetical protein